MKHRWKIRHLLAVPFLALSGGCIDYQIHTTLNQDGSGQRAVTIEMTDARSVDEIITRREFIDLMHLTEDRGWRYRTEVQNDGDTTHVFHRETELADLRSWSELNDELRISGSRATDADSRVGYLRAGEVQFRNRVDVRADGRTDGATTFRYQESFTWEKGADAEVEGFGGEMERSIRVAYPKLTERELGEVRGIIRVNLWAAVEEGILDSGNEDVERLWEESLDGIVTLASKTVRTRYPDASEDDLRKSLDLFDEDYQGEDPIEQLLPGLARGGGQITFRLTMPGEVTSTNAHERDGNRLTWEFNTDDALASPVVLVAESVVGGDRAR